MTGVQTCALPISGRLEQGRPAREEISTEKVKAELEKGKTITELAKEFNCSRGTIYNRLKEKD